MVPLTSHCFDRSSAPLFYKGTTSTSHPLDVGIPVPREPFSFGGLYGTKSKFGDCDITGDGAMEFFSNRIKITSKWTASYGSKRTADGAVKTKDAANFDGKM